MAVRARPLPEHGQLGLIRGPGGGPPGAERRPPALRAALAYGLNALTILQTTIGQPLYWWDERASNNETTAPSRGARWLSHRGPTWRNVVALHGLGSRFKARSDRATPTTVRPTPVATIRAPSRGDVPPQRDKVEKPVSAMLAHMAKEEPPSHDGSVRPYPGMRRSNAPPTIDHATH